MNCSIVIADESRERLSTVALETRPSACEVANDHLKVKFSVFQSLGNWKIS